MHRMIVGALAVAGLVATASFVVIEPAIAQAPAVGGAAPEVAVDTTPPSAKAQGKRKRPARMARRSRGGGGGGAASTEQRVRAGIQKYAPEYQGYVPASR